MYANSLPSCLVGITLTVSTHSGPHVVYHYPPAKYSSSKKQQQNRKPRPQRSDSEDESSSEEHSSGLSDSELSTDYADYSSDASGDSLDSLPQLQHEETVNSANDSGINNELRSRQSQISANKLFQLLNSTNNNGSISGSNADNSLRDSFHSTKTSTNISFTDESRADEEVAEVDEELKKLVDNLLDKSIFQQDQYQDPSKVLNFNAEFVAELCSPRKEMCNTRFEFTVDELCFLGLPIHADNKGRWKKSKKKKHLSKRSSRNSNNKTRSVSDAPERVIQSDSLGEQSDPEASRSEMLNEMYDVLNAEKEEFDSLEQSIHMFQIIFILNPKLIEYNEMVDDMYHYVVTRLSLILRYIQGRSGYVTRECVNIMKCKDHVMKHSQTYKSMKTPWEKGEYLYQRILSESSLARALTKCFNRISSNQIANLELDDDKIVSLQIPIKTEYSLLPNLKESFVLQGSFLSSILNENFIGGINGTAADDTDLLHSNDDNLLDYGLLLLDEPENVIKDLEKSSFDNGLTDLLLISFVKQLKPTVRLHQYKYLLKELLDSNENVYDSQFYETTLKSLCMHLIYWRHARVILPISSRNVYIVSPLAPISGHTSEEFSHDEYDTLTSGKDVPASHNEDLLVIYQNRRLFSEKFPSLPSLTSFLQLISTQKPKPFGHIIPSNEHKAMYLNALAWLTRYGYLTQLLTFVYIRVDKRIKVVVDEDLERDGVKANSKDSASSNFISGRENYNADFDDLEMLDDNDYTIILEPERNTALEKRWLYKCAESLPADLQLLFKQLVKYFNGRISLEYVMIKENIPRHDMKRLLSALGKYVVEVKHW